MTAVAACSDGSSDARPVPSETGGPIIQPGTPGGPNSTLTTAPTTSAVVDPDDVAFLSDMMVHHQQAIQMSQWARTKASNRSVRVLAERIRVGQQPEIDAMRSMLTQWRQQVPDLAHAGHMDHSSMPGMASPTELASLERSAGAAFDRLFLRLMIRHHQGAVTMSRVVSENGQDLRTGEIAQDIGVTQTKEVAVMQQLLKSL